MTANPVFQSETIESLRRQMGDDAGTVLGELIRLYLEQSRDLVDQIEAARAPLDLTRLRAAAHKLKGSTATLGGDRLAAVCHRIELAPPAELDAQGAVQAVRREYELLAQQLRCYRRSLLERPSRTESD